MKSRTRTTKPLPALLLGLLSCFTTCPLLAQSPTSVDTRRAAAEGKLATRLDGVHVVARRLRDRALEATSRVSDERISRIAASHANESLSRLPGVWISRGSGQEQLTAIRSPVLTGTGACGAFLMLEDGVPIRPAAFCNVNQLAELPTELAGGIEVLRGPGTAVHGSNALHGVIDVRPRRIDEELRAGSFETGAQDFARIMASAADGERWRIDGVATDAGSFRVDEGYRQHKWVAQWQDAQRSGEPRLLLSASRLDQDTAGFIAGFDAYRDSRRDDNANPEAFRRGHALRLQGRWSWWLDDEASLSFVPYARTDAMRFLQHFNLGQPLEENQSESVGAQLLWQREGGWQPQAGMDFEFASGDLLEIQAQALTTGTAAQQAIRPAGRHYDYSVDTANVAAFVQWNMALASRWQLQAGLRGEVHRFDYANRIGDGNLRDDGSACGFGGCLFNRPADRRDQFSDASGSIGLQWDVHDQHAIVARLARAFRVPQAGELYRLQRGQAVADLQPETLVGLELGWRAQARSWSATVDAYDYRKQHVILRDALGFTINDGRTRHRGVESGVQWQWHPQWSLGAELAFADHRYAFDRDAAAGEVIRVGNRIDTAPRWLGGARLAHTRALAGEFELEWRHQGSYDLDAANTARYPGHDLLNLRWHRAFNDRWTLSARVLNVQDRRYAERADFAFGQYRYFPGAGRELFVSIAWQR
ncbi:MAG: TonB-dependent receptor [Pseudomarimonas sp.]